MLKIASICGCALPNTEFFAQYIAEEIGIFVNDMGYGNLTVDEIVLAFRLNIAGEESIPFTGVCVNVDYIAKVLRAYFEKRQLLDGILKNKIDGYEL